MGVHKDKLRVAVCGAGVRARQAIYPALSYMENVEIAAVCDIAKELAADTAVQYAVPAVYDRGVDDYKRMAEEIRPDAILSIGNPHQLYDSWMWILERGIPLAIEKPLGLTMHQAESLAYMAAAKKTATQVLFQRRYSPIARKALEMCRGRGDITHAVCRFYKCEPRPFIGSRDHMLDDTVHSIDSLRWICGGEIEGIDCVTRRVGTPDINFITALLRFDNGATGCLINSWTSGKRLFSAEMHAPGIYADVEHEVGGDVYTDGGLEGVRLNAKECAGSERLEAYTGVEAAIGDFLASIGRDEPSECHFGDAVKTMRAAHIILAKALI